MRRAARTLPRPRRLGDADDVRPVPAAVLAPWCRDVDGAAQRQAAADRARRRSVPPVPLAGRCGVTAPWPWRPTSGAVAMDATAGICLSPVCRPAAEPVAGRGVL